MKPNGYYNGFAYMGFVPSIGKYQQKEWLYQMADELGLIDMDYQDYLETDEWLEKFGN